MLLLYRQIIIAILVASVCSKPEPPPGYVKPTETSDKNTPKYEYGYNIEDTKGEGQGKLETREGIYALGRYYVQGSDSKQSVQYYADDWGYHPLVEYSNIGPHSKSRAHLLLGVEAVKALATNKFAPGSVSPNQHVTDSINKINENRSGKQSLTAPIAGQSQPRTVLVQQEQPQQLLIQQGVPQQILIQQNHPQTAYLQQQQQNIIIEHQQPLQQNILVSQPQTQVIVENERKSPSRLNSGAVSYQNILKHTNNQADYDETVLTEQNSGGYGAKINLKTPTKLIETTKNLVSGQDVLNINGAIDSSIEANIETSTTKTLIADYPSESLTNNVEVNNKGLSGITSTTLAPTTEISLNQEPIIVADLQENTIASTEKSLSSSTVSIATEPSTVFVTPRPVSTKFLAPITAGIQLQSIENQEETLNDSEKQSYVVEIQRSLPLYLGKLEYLQNSNIETQSVVKESIGGQVQEKAAQDLALGKTLLLLPEPLPLVQENKVFVQQLPETNIRENFLEADQQYAQEVQHHVAVQTPTVVEKNVPVPVVQTKIVEKPVEVTRVINQPVPIEVPVHVPVTVEKQIPVTVEKIVEKPVPVTKIVEKPIHIPQPYPVEKIVEKPVHVPVEVTRYIDRPYPVQVPVAHPVPYPVDRIVEKIVKQPYPVEVRVPVEVQVPVPVEKIVEKQVPVPQYIEKPVPYEKIVEKPVPHYIDRPYPVEVKVPVPQPYILSYTVPVVQQQQQQYNSEVVKQSHHYQQQQQHQQQHEQQQQQQQNIYTYLTAYPAVHTKDYLPPKETQKLNNGYLPPVTNCEHQQQSQGTKNVYQAVKTDDYIGLVPPKFQSTSNYPTKYRNARSNFNTNLRLEYGFMPPLIPSLEIDENGQPIEQKEN